MRIEYLLIRNFKSIRELEINDIEDVLILVGRNNAGKSVVLDAIRAVTGDYEVSLRDFNDNEGNISITVRISIEDEDLAVLYQKGQVSSFKHYDLWYKDFCNKLPSLKDGILEFEYVYSRDGKIKYRDGIKKNNIYIKTVLPRIFYVDNMERQHLVIRVPDKRDRRTNKIHLTENGKKLEEKARFIANKTLKEALHGLTLEELRISQEVLRKIFTNTKD